MSDRLTGGQLVPRRVPEYASATLIEKQSVQGVILNDLSLLNDRFPLHPNVSHYFPIHGALTGKDGNIVRIRRGENHTAAGASCPIQKNAAADVSRILLPLSHSFIYPVIT